MNRDKRFSLRMAGLVLLGIGLVSGPASVQAQTAITSETAPFFEQVRAPFWSSSKHSEPVLFLQLDPNRPPSARLLFAPQSIERVTNATRETVYEAGKDYVLGEDGVLTLPEGSRITFQTAEQLHPLMTSDSPKIRGYRLDESRGILFGEGSFYHALQVEVTYQADGTTWAGPRPEFKGMQVPRLQGRLKEHQPVHILVCGDSISAGGNASKVTMAKPGCPAYPELIGGALQVHSGSPVTVTNVAVGGWTSDQGLAHAREARPGKGKPDLTIIAFGMNDVSRRDADRYQKNIQGIIDAVRQDAPDCEFLLVSTMLSNPEWFLPMDQFPIYRDALLALQGPGVVVADVTKVWESLEKRKTVYDLTGNGVNHPNDFGHIVYAQVLYQTLIAPTASASGK